MERKLKKITVLLFFLLIHLSGYSQQLISTGSVWKYLDDGSDQGTAWKETTFDDSGWQSGNAQLGFGDDDEAAVINNSGGITYYFRQEFDVTDPDAQNGLKIRLLRDDGAVIYINGTEVLRSNMPSGTITYTTPAANAVGGDDEDIFYDFFITSETLTTGTNVIATEIHQISTSSSDISFDMEMEFADYTVDLFRKRPYILYPGTNTEMLLLWQLNENGTCEISWGEDNSYSDGTLSVSEYGTDKQFKIQLNNLNPGTKYYYKVSCEGEDTESSFVTGSNDTDTAFSFYAYGDTRSQPAEHDGVAEQISAKISDDTASQTFIVNSGDLVENGDDELDWDNQFFLPQYENINEMLSKLPYISAVGNHEGNGTLFSKYFPYPMYEAGGAYFSFDYANAHFIVIDQYVDYSDGSTQYDWIVNDLENSDKAWKFAMFHEPGWSAGGHSNEADVQNILQPLFEQYDVSLVINGHNHYYSHALVNNIHHITTGGGGAPLYDPNPSYPNIIKTDKSYHFLKIDVKSDSLTTVSAIRQNGTIIETFDIDKTSNVSVKNNPDKNFKIYRKQNKIIIENGEDLNADADIYDISGKIILSKNIKHGRNTVYLKKQTGIFIIKISRNGKILTVKKL